MKKWTLDLTKLFEFIKDFEIIKMQIEKNKILNETVKIDRIDIN